MPQWKLALVMPLVAIPFAALFIVTIGEILIACTILWGEHISVVVALAFALGLIAMCVMLDRRGQKGNPAAPH